MAAADLGSPGEPSSWCWWPPALEWSGKAYPNTIGLAMAVVAPALMVMAIIMFMGKVSGAHLNPAVSFAFALRG